MGHAKDHFTAIVEVKKVTFHTSQAPSGRVDPSAPLTRQSEEVARVIVRANDLETLVKKVKDHLDIEAETGEYASDVEEE